MTIDNMNATKTTLTVFAAVAALAVVGLGLAPALIQQADATLLGGLTVRDFLNENNQENEDESCENDEGIISCVHQGSGDDDITFES
jgi:hypothetical protein